MIGVRIGAQITVNACGRRWMQEFRSGSCYLSNSDMRLHFGLRGCAQVDHIDVRWPSGLHETFSYIEARQHSDRFVTLLESSGNAQ